jgi:hypothetical protein
MRTAAYQIGAVEFIEAVGWAAVEHLAQARGKVERGAAIDLVLVLPISRGADALLTNAPFQIFQAELFELLHHDRAKGSGLL